MTPPAAAEWWRTAVIYQVYPRSFADSDGDGIGDLPGVTAHLDALVELGVDAVWLSPFYPSPQRDAGYDVADYCDVDPLFGTLADADRLLTAAHARGLRVIIDLVPNHSSDRHPWFQAALRAAPGSAERGRYLFRDGRGPHGAAPPTDWQSMFGGPAWTRVTEPDDTPGQWYLHLFDTSQPDFDWTNVDVRDEFRRILRFWLDRGVDGFRIDVAHGLVKDPSFPDWLADPDQPDAEGPYWGQPGVHEIYRDWHALVAAYPGDRALCAEAWLPTPERTALWVRPDELHQAFNFPYLLTGWDAAALRRVIDRSLQAFGAVGAPSTWVLSNHDVIRHATRLALRGDDSLRDGLGPRSPERPDPVLGLRRARAATALMLALPGSAYLYQGEELGLPEVIDLPDAARADPTWFRSGGTRYGRDGCRVPIPWRAGAPAAGFSPAGRSWLPQPPGWSGFARDRQQDDPGSTLALYRHLLRERRIHALGAGTVTWLDGWGADAVALRNGAVCVVANLGTAALPLPPGARVLVASEPGAVGEVAPDVTVWFEVT